MPAEDETRFARDLRADLSHVRMEGDFMDLVRRKGGANAASRVRSAVVALALAGAASVFLWFQFSQSGSGRLGGAPTASTPAGSLNTVPEGELLIREGSKLAIIPSGKAVGRPFAPAELVEYALSPDGTTTVGTLARREQSGLFRPFALALIDTTDGQQNIIEEVGPTAAIGPPVIWSPDGAEIAYIRSEWTSDATQGAFPGEPDATYPCVVAVDGSGAKCYPEVGRTLSIAWSPDGAFIWLGSGDGGPITALNVGTTELSNVVQSNGGADVEEALRQLGVSGVNSIQFVNPAPSSSGKYVAALALVNRSSGPTIFVPMIFAVADGSVVASGQPNPDLPQAAWSPLTDVLAYSTGVVGIETAEDPPPSARTLTPSGDDQLLLSTGDTPNVPGSSDPLVLGLEWSPSGDWLAVAGREQIRFVSSSGAESGSLDPYGSEGGELLGWAA